MVTPQKTVGCVALADLLSCTTMQFPASATHPTALHVILWCYLFHSVATFLQIGMPPCFQLAGRNPKDGRAQLLPCVVAAKTGEQVR